MAVCPGVFRLAEARDGGLARIRVPGGGLSAGQLAGLARLAREQGNGIVDLTHRANLQIRGIDPGAVARLADGLRAIDLLAADPAADRLRNILASPLSGLEADEIVDVRPAVAALDRALQATPEIHDLSPKFSFVLDGGGTGGVAALAHDIGFTAERGPDGPAFRVGLADRATDAIVAPDDAPGLAVALAEAVMALSGHAPPRMRSALSGRTPAEVLDFACRGLPDMALRHVAPPPVAPRLAPVLGPVRQRASGVFAYGLGIPLGRLTDETAEALADLAEAHGSGTVRLTPWQAVFIADVAEEDVEAVRSRAHALGLQTEPHDIDIRVAACSGATGCLRTQCDTKADGTALLRALAASGLRPDRPLTIHLSGCARGCAHPEESELLLLGRPDGTGYDAYRHARPGRAEALDPIAGPLPPAELDRLVIEFLQG